MFVGGRTSEKGEWTSRQNCRHRHFLRRQRRTSPLFGSTQSDLDLQPPFSRSVLGRGQGPKWSLPVPHWNRNSEKGDVEPKDTSYMFTRALRHEREVIPLSFPWQRSPRSYDPSPVYTSVKSGHQGSGLTFRPRGSSIGRGRTERVRPGRPDVHLLLGIIGRPTEITFHSHFPTRPDKRGLKCPRVLKVC